MPINIKRKVINELKYNLYLVIYSILVSGLLYYFKDFKTSYSFVLISTIIIFVVTRYIYELVEFVFIKLKKKV